MKPDAVFVPDFWASQPVVRQVAAWLEGLRGDVFVPKPILRQDSAWRVDYQDDGDIKVVRNGKTWNIEVKHRQVSFTNAADYPFGSILVDEAYKLTDLRLKRLGAYVIVNRERTCLAWIGGSTAESWVPVPGFDRAQGRECRWLACPKRMARFVSLPAFPEVA